MGELGGGGGVGVGGFEGEKQEFLQNDGVGGGGSGDDVDQLEVMDGLFREGGQ